MNIEVTFEPGDLEKILYPDIFAKVAIPEALIVIRDLWIDAVSGTVLPGMPRAIDEPSYSDALRDPSALVYPADSPFSGAVVVQPETDVYALAVKLETGRKERDMKPTLLSGKKAKQGKRGKYVVVPIGFRTVKPGALAPNMMSGMFHAESPFRTVSERSPENSWVYPGILPARVLDAVATASESRIDDVISQLLR